jgi:catechol 2,3-dioxygenase-like lactoylglutathione lyase family enzyme
MFELADHASQEQITGKAGARIGNALQVRLVMDLSQAKEYYQNKLGFSVDGWGHAEREGVGFLLQQADRQEDVRPNAKAAGRECPNNWHGPVSGWDTYAYSDYDGVQQLYEEFAAKGAIIAYEPQIEDMGAMKWKEFAVKDLDGYVIVFGGGARSGD